MGPATVAILGGGNGAHMMAAHMALEGVSVNMVEHPRFEKNFRHVIKTREITVSGIGPQGVAKLNLATTDFARGLDGVKWIHLVMAGTGHELFIDAMLPHLSDGQNVVIWAGNMASVRLYSLLHRRELAKTVRIFETNTLPYGVRLRSPGHVESVLWATRVQIAAMPANLAPPVNDLKRFFPQLEKGKNALASALDNPNPTVHAAASVMNIGRIEYSKGDFYLYREGLTPAVAKVIRKVYDEGAAIAKKFGVKLIRYADEEFDTTSSVMGVEFKAPTDTAAVIGAVKGPSSLQDRYLSEDIPHGLVLRSELGKIAGVATPVIDGIIALGSAASQQDYRKTGRTLNYLGLGRANRNAISRYLAIGVNSERSKRRGRMR